MTNVRTLLRRGIVLSAVIALVTLMAACGSSSDSGDDGENAGGGTVAVTDGVVELSADNLEFDAGVIQAPAGEAFTVTFTNDDSAAHNVAIYTEEGGEEIIKGEVIDGGATTEVQVEALDVGEYYFVCDIHPGDMSGSVVVED